jgi:hypothetical protein
LRHPGGQPAIFRIALRQRGFMAKNRCYCDFAALGDFLSFPISWHENCHRGLLHLQSPAGILAVGSP